MPRTELLLKPSLDECVSAAVSSGMPEAEGRKFFYHYDSNGWKVGKVPMKSFAGAMGGWRERWLERTGSVASASEINGKHHSAPMGGATIMVKQKELERVLERMRVIQRSYDSHQDLRQGDRAEMLLLKKRRDELRRDLGVMI